MKSFNSHNSTAKMKKLRFISKIYYQFKPLIPRRFQIWLRRKVVAYKRWAYSSIWPVDKNSDNPPESWKGCPGQKEFALILTHDVDAHPDFINFDSSNFGLKEYPFEYYEEFLNYIKKNYKGKYWHVLPRNMARFWARNFGHKK